MALDHAGDRVNSRSRAGTSPRSTRASIGSRTSSGSARRSPRCRRPRGRYRRPAGGWRSGRRCSASGACGSTESARRRDPQTAGDRGDDQERGHVNEVEEGDKGDLRGEVHVRADHRGDDHEVREARSEARRRRWSRRSPARPARSGARCGRSSPSRGCAAARRRWHRPRPPGRGRARAGAGHSRRGEGIAARTTCPGPRTRATPPAMFTARNPSVKPRTVRADRAPVA